MSAHGVHDLDEFEARLAGLRATQDPPAAAGAFVAYTDGASHGNPGPAGWAAAVFSAEESTQWLLFGHLRSSTNNRAEALGVLACLEWLPDGSRLSLHSDSELSIRLFEGRYKLKSNKDIWDRILARRLEKRLEVMTEWVRGHAGDQLNELADRLATLGARNGALEDLGTLAVPAPTPPPAELDGLEPRTDWEREFVASVKKQLRAGRQLSPKQQAVVDRIRSNRR